MCWKHKGRVYLLAMPRVDLSCWSWDPLEESNVIVTGGNPSQHDALAVELANSLTYDYIVVLTWAGGASVWKRTCASFCYKMTDRPVDYVYEVLGRIQEQQQFNAILVVMDSVPPFLDADTQAALQVLSRLTRAVLWTVHTREEYAFMSPFSRVVSARTHAPQKSTLFQRIQTHAADALPEHTFLVVKGVDGPPVAFMNAKGSVALQLPPAVAAFNVDVRAQARAQLTAGTRGGT
jgi:hypothetical protein